MAYKFNIFTGTFDIVSAAVVVATYHFLLEATSGDILCEDGSYLTQE